MFENDSVFFLVGDGGNNITIFQAIVIIGDEKDLWADDMLIVNPLQCQVKG